MDFFVGKVGSLTVRGAKSSKEIERFWDIEWNKAKRNVVAKHSGRILLELNLGVMWPE